MNEAIAWLEAHEKLAGWAQFLGATIALAVTWWLARGEARARRINLTNRLKSTMLLVFLMHEGVKETLADLKAGNRPDITAAMQSDNNDLFAAEFHSFDQVTSTFMANNHIALIGWTATLRRLYSGIQTGTQTDVDVILGNAMIGLNDICSNIGKEVARLGGRFEVTDDRAMLRYLRPNLRAQVFLWASRVQSELRVEAGVKD